MTDESSTRKSTRRALLALIIVLGFVPTAESQDELLLHDGSGGSVPVEGESRVRVIGIEGTIAVRTAKQGELRYEVRSLDSRREERPIALWGVGRALELRRLAGADPERLLLEMAVPPELTVELELADSNVQVSGLRSDLEIRGSGMKIDSRGVYGVVELAVDESTVRLDGTDTDVNVDGVSLELTLKRIGGYVSLSLQSSTVDVTEVAGAIEGSLEDTVLTARALGEGASLQARGGSVELGDVRKEVDLQLEQAPVVLSGVAGRAIVETDSDVRFRTSQATLTINSFGGKIHGTANTGPVEVTSDRSQVILEEMQGNVRVTGDGLNILLREMQGATVVQATSSRVTVEKATGKLDIETDFGDVHVKEVASPVRVVSSEGNVVIADSSGPVELHANGNRVDVSWTKLPTDQDQLIENENGEVTVRFPAPSACRVEVESSFGRVRSELPNVRVTDDERFASGVLGGAGQPTVQVKSSGDILITAHRGAAAVPAKPSQ